MFEGKGLPGPLRVAKKMPQVLASAVSAPSRGVWAITVLCDLG